MWGVFVVTFIVFPNVFFAFKYFDFLGKGSDWFNLTIILSFNIFDTIGRKMGGLKMFNLSMGTVPLLALSRIIFLPLSYYIAISNKDDNGNNNGIAHSDWFKILSLTLFSFSNGYVST